MTDISPPAPSQTVVVAQPAPSPRSTWKDWLPILSTLIVVCGLLITGGRLLGQVNDNTRRIDVLERRADQRDEQLRDIQVRVAGIDAKLDILVERARAPRS